MGSVLGKYCSYVLLSEGEVHKLAKNNETHIPQYRTNRLVQ